MFRRLGSTKTYLTASILSLFAAFNASAALAQLPWGYSPLTGSNSWLWLSRSIFNPGNLFRGSYGYGTGNYIVNTLAYNAVYGASRGVNNFGKKAAAKQIWTNPANGINAPAVDQIAPASWYKGPDPEQEKAISNPLTANTPPMAPNSDPFFMPIPQTFSDKNQTQEPVANSQLAPMPAPDFRLFNRNNTPEKAADKTDSAKAASHSSSPFAQCFIDLVNEKYDGNISDALKDKQTLSYARALGIVEHKFAKMPEDRIELIKQILKDTQEDALTKVNTIRLLIKH